MRVKIKGQLWVDPSQAPIAIELTTDERAMIAAAPRNQSKFVFGEDPDVSIAYSSWIAEENPPPESTPKTEVASKAAPKKKATPKKKAKSKR